MTSLRFKIDWDPASEFVVADELRATWARVEISVGDDCITLLEDVRTGTSRRAFHASLYPLAEWVAFNWWLLLADGRPSWRSRGVEGAPGHSFRAASDGFPWPNLVLIPEHDFVRVAWTKWPSRATSPYPVRYLGSGVARAPLADVRTSLADLVEAVLERLREDEVSDTPLEREWSAIRSLDAEEVEFCIASAQLGLDPFSDGADLSDLISEVFENMTPGMRDEFLDAADPKQLSSSLNWTLEARKAGANATGVSSVDLSAIVATAVPDLTDDSLAGEPWQVGYAAASRSRDALGLGAHEPLPPDPLLQASHLNVDDRGLIGLAIRRDEEAPALVAARYTRSTTMRFAAARALWTLAADMVEPFLITASHSPAQQASRAFGAELIAPAPGIESFLGGQPINDETVAEIADHYGASELLIRHQLENQILQR